MDSSPQNSKLSVINTGELLTWGVRVVRDAESFFFFNFVRKYEVDRRSPLLVVVCAAAAFFRSHDGDGALMSSFLQRCCFHCPHGNDVNMLNGVFHIFQKIPFLGPKTALPCGRAKTVKNFTVFMHKRCSVDWTLECGRWSTW